MPLKEPKKIPVLHSVTKKKYIAYRVLVTITMEDHRCG